MSLLGKKWTLLSQNTGGDLLATLLKNRGLTTETECRRFLSHDLGALHDPFQLKDMDKAVARVQQAITSHEKIMIFGDYDVDGITGTALLYDFFQRQGVPALTTLPHREKDGYGLKDFFIQQFSDQGIQLLITVDCGTANAREIALARERGIDVIVVDHHQAPLELPNAVALINPCRSDCAYPCKHLCGSTLAYKLITALERQGAEKGDSSYQLSLVVMGLVADCVPLLDENRLLTMAGLEALRNTAHPGIQSLLRIAGVKPETLDTITIGFQLAPRLNAAGRMETPNHSLELLLGNTEKAMLINTLNQKRQATVERTVEEALEQMAQKKEIPLVIVLSNPGWQPGVLGLIASKLVERFQRPAIILQEQEHQFVASCRSLSDFDITDFLREEAGELFSSFGGHKMAGGFALPKKHWGLFQNKVARAAPEYIDPAKLTEELRIDCALDSQELHFDTLKTIKAAAPYGMQNPEPLFALKNATIMNTRIVGSAANHLQLKVASNGKTFPAIAFRFGKHFEAMNRMEQADVAFHLDLNEWNGVRNLQLKVVDVRASA
ncbi:single-stranded-DNA-specific exonuclease RecJ [Candidatus Peregrinibacteria bacterium]|nr:single-stranded-DNA-specific exonuclease RecJ [Candidatus Peregrinibacteria bacterium]